MSQRIIRNSFKNIPGPYIERQAQNYEERLENLLRQNIDKHQERIQVLFYLCDVLWRALTAKERGKLSRKVDRSLNSEFIIYYNALKKLK